MKRALGFAIVVSVMIAGVAIADMEDGRTPVHPYVQTPDGGMIRARADEQGRVYTRVVSADGGAPEVNLSVNTGSAWGEVLCPSASSVSVPATALEGRREVLVQNLGPNPVYLCPGTPCTVADGVKLQADEEWRSFAFGPGITLWCIATVADQVSGAGLRYIEVK